MLIVAVELGQLSVSGGGGGAGATVMPQLGDVAVAPELSVTVPVKENGPAVVGVPVTPPVEFRFRTDGREPEAMP